MYVNNRDEINYHKFLRSMRNSQHVSLEKVALGVYKKSAMSRIESGERLPDKLVRDRLTARLGISGEEYEEYLLPREYKQWECRMDIIRCINKKDVAGAEEKIAAYAKNYHGNKVDVQFALVMEFMVMEMKGCSEEELYNKIFETMNCTVVDAEAALGGLHLLADQELNLIMEYVRLRKEVVPECDLTEWKLKIYDKIVTYVEKSKLDKIAQAKVYSKVACHISELILTAYANEESIHYALELCTRGIETLRDTVRLYYFVELNEYRIKLIEKLHAYVKDEEEAKELDELSRTSDEWAKLFHELYTENELPVYMENFTHLYTETECNNACEVIRTRRAMMGLTREKMVGNACVERTLARIELENHNPSMITVRELFDRMGLCAEYKRARVVTSDAEALRLLEKLYIKVNEERYREAYQLYNKVCSIIDMDVTFNEQEMNRIKICILGGLGRLTQEEQCQMLIDTLELTVAIDNLMSEREKYLSIIELSCVQNLSMLMGISEVEYCKKYLECLCNKILEMEEMKPAYMKMYEMIMIQHADYMGNIGRYDESKKISEKLLKESLRNRRMSYLMNYTYNNLWNYQKIMESNSVSIDNTYIYKSLVIGLHLSNLVKQSNWKIFFQQRLCSYEKNTISEDK